MPATPDDHPRATALLRRAIEAHAGERIALAALLQPLQRRAFGFLLILLAVPNFMPVAIGIGGVMGVGVIALGVQMAAGLDQPWLPHWLGRRTLSRAALLRFLQRVAPATRWLERACRPRLPSLTQRPLTVPSGVVMIVLGLLLALPLPFTNYLFGGLLLAFAFALIERDGALLLGIWLATLASLAVSATLSRALLELLRSYF
jgi:hypothetical protein